MYQCIKLELQTFILPQLLIHNLGLFKRVTVIKEHSPWELRSHKLIILNLMIQQESHELGSAFIEVRGKALTGNPKVIPTVPFLPSLLSDAHHVFEVQFLGSHWGF